MAAGAARAVDADSHAVGEGDGPDGRILTLPLTAYWKSRGIDFSQFFSRTSLPFSKSFRVPE